MTMFNHIIEFNIPCSHCGNAEADTRIDGRDLCEDCAEDWREIQADIDEYENFPD